MRGLGEISIAMPPPASSRVYIYTVRGHAFDIKLIKPSQTRRAKREGAKRDIIYPERVKVKVKAPILPTSGARGCIPKLALQRQ